MPTVKLHLSIGYANASHSAEEEIDDELWEWLDEAGREELLDELAQNWANNYINISAFVQE